MPLRIALQMIFIKDNFIKIWQRKEQQQKKQR